MCVGVCECVFVCEYVAADFNIHVGADLVPSDQQNQLILSFYPTWSLISLILVVLDLGSRTRTSYRIKHKERF